MQKGTRVGAVISANNQEVILLGYGVYEGDFVPDENAVGFGPLLRSIGRTNPKIVLDSGDVAWGCECWFGEEDSLKTMIEDKLAHGAVLTEVKISDVRSEIKKEG